MKRVSLTGNSLTIATASEQCQTMDCRFGLDFPSFSPLFNTCQEARITTLCDAERIELRLGRVWRE